MPRILIGLALTFIALPAWAQQSNRKWVKSGKDPAMVTLEGCVDQNSIVKGADGRTYYTMTTNLFGSCEEAPEDNINVVNVNCNEGMSGENIMMKFWSYRKDGKYNWQPRDDGVMSDSLMGQSAKFVCHK